MSIEAVVNAVASGRISEARIDASVRKLLMAKHEFSRHRNHLVDVEALRSRVGTVQNLGPAPAAAEKVITLVRDSVGLVPPKLARYAKVVSITVSAPVDLAVGRACDAELRSQYPRLQSLQLSPEEVAEATAGAVAGNTHGYRISPDPASLPASVENALNIARGADEVIVASYIGAATNTAAMVPTKGLPELLNGLKAANTKVVLVSFNNPYVQLGLPFTDAHLLSWALWTVSQRAAARALLGRVTITGTLPITIPGVAKFGDGIVRQ